MKAQRRARCTECGYRRPDVWMRSRWSKRLQKVVQKLLCAPCGRKLGFYFRPLRSPRRRAA